MRAESHAALGNSLCPRLFKLIEDFPRHPLLAEAHLRDGVLDRLPYDLVRQVDQLLRARGELGTNASELLLGGLDLLLPRHLPVGADHLHDLLPLIPHPPPRVRIEGHLHVLSHLAVGEIRGVGGRLLPCLGFLDFFVEDGRALGPVRDTEG